MLPSRVNGDKTGLAAWAIAFQQDRLFFHASHWCAAIHRDLLWNEVRSTKDRDALMHQARAINMLQHRISNLSQTNVDWVIYSIIALSRTDPQQYGAEHDFVSPFVPHVPQTNWTNLYGRTEMIAAHRKGIYQLVQLQGGLRKLKTPGLASRLALYVPLMFYSRQCHLHSSCNTNLKAGLIFSQQAQRTKNRCFRDFGTSQWQISILYTHYRCPLQRR